MVNLDLEALKHKLLISQPMGCFLFVPTMGDGLMSQILFSLDEEDDDF